MFASRAAREFNTVYSWFERGVYDAEFEMRYPFLSRPLVEFSLRLPVHMRIRPFGRKWILRQAMTGVLPEPIRMRQAKGGIDSRIIWAMQQERTRIRRAAAQSDPGRPRADPPERAAARRRRNALRRDTQPDSADVGAFAGNVAGRP